MTIDTDKLYKSIVGVTPAAMKNVTLTVTKGSSDLVVSSVKDSFAIFQTIHGVADAEPINAEVNASLLKRTLARPSADTVNIEMKTSDRILLSMDNGDFYSELVILNLGNTDSIDDRTDEKYIKEIHVKSLSTYVKGTKHALASKASAIADPDARKTSFFVEADDDGNLRVSATDRHRISLRQGSIKEIKNRFVIPGTEMKAAIPLLGRGTCLRIPKDGKFLQLVRKNAVIIMPTLDCGFFPVNDIIEKIDNEKILKLVADRKTMIRKCRASQIFNKKVVFGVLGNKITIEAYGPDGSSRISRMDTEKEPGNKNLMIGFTAKYLIDALVSLKSERVEMVFGKGYDGCMIEPHLEEGKKQMPGKSIEVVFPVRI